MLFFQIIFFILVAVQLFHFHYFPKHTGGILKSNTIMSPVYLIWSEKPARYLFYVCLGQLLPSYNVLLRTASQNILIKYLSVVLPKVLSVLPSPGGVQITCITAFLHLNSIYSILLHLIFYLFIFFPVTPGLSVWAASFGTCWSTSASTSPSPAGSS